MTLFSDLVIHVLNTGGYKMIEICIVLINYAAKIVQVPKTLL